MRMQSFHEQSRKALTIWCFCTGIRDPLTGSSSVLLSDLCCAQCRLCSHPRPSLQTHTKRDEDAGCHACGLFLYNSVKYCLYTVCFFNEGQLYIIHTPNNARETFIRDRFTFFFFSHKVLLWPFLHWPTEIIFTIDFVCRHNSNMSESRNGYGVIYISNVTLLFRVRTKQCCFSSHEFS